MTINLYSCSDDTNVVNKTLTSELSLTGTLRESCSVLNPAMNIEAETLVGKNYAYIPEFGRYYYIVDITSEYKNLWRVNMKVDVLMSFKSEFLGLNAIVSRNEARFNRYISDSRVIQQTNPILMTMRFPGEHFSKDNLVLAVAGNKSVPVGNIEKVLEVAVNELGYLEKASTADLDSKRGNPGSGNYTKYARDLDFVLYFAYNVQGLAWCSTFLNWCFWKAFGKTDALTLTYEPLLNNLAASNTEWYKYFNNNDAIVQTPQRGDIAFFEWEGDPPPDVDHCALVYQVDLDNNKFTSIEGNTRSPQPSEIYDGVYLKEHIITSPLIRGFGRPNWSGLSVN